MDKKRRKIFKCFSFWASFGLVELNQHAVLSFVLVLLFLAGCMILLGAVNSKHAKTEEAQAYAIEMEKANFFRMLLEENTDAVIENTIFEEINKKNSEPNSIRGRIAEELYEFFKEIEEKYGENPKISFFEANYFSKKYSSIHSVPKEPLKKKTLSECFKVIVFEEKKNVHFVEAYYTGCLGKDRIVFAVVEFPYSGISYVIPLDYSKKVVSLNVI